MSCWKRSILPSDTRDGPTAVFLATPDYGTTEMGSALLHHDCRSRVCAHCRRRRKQSLQARLRQRLHCVLDRFDAIRRTFLFRIRHHAHSTNKQATEFRAGAHEGVQETSRSLSVLDHRHESIRLLNASNSRTNRNETGLLARHSPDAHFPSPI